MRRNSMDIVTNKYYILTKKFKIFGNFDTAADAAKEAKDGDVVMCANEGTFNFGILVSYYLCYVF